MNAAIPSSVRPIVITRNWPIREIIAPVKKLGANIAMFNVWQNRGKVAPAEVEQSTYGRPLVREGV